MRKKKTKAILLIIPGSKAIVHPRGKKTCTSPEVCKNLYQGIVDECNNRRPDGRCDKCCDGIHDHCHNGCHDGC